jgi:hypothetical protein
VLFWDIVPVLFLGIVPVLFRGYSFVLQKFLRAGITCRDRYNIYRKKPPKRTRKPGGIRLFLFFPENKRMLTRSERSVAKPKADDIVPVFFRDIVPVLFREAIPSPHGVIATSRGGHCAASPRDKPPRGVDPRRRSRSSPVGQAAIDRFGEMTRRTQPYRRHGASKKAFFPGTARHTVPVSFWEGRCATTSSRCSSGKQSPRHMVSLRGGCSPRRSNLLQEFIQEVCYGYLPGCKIFVPRNE